MNFLPLHHRPPPILRLSTSSPLPATRHAALQHYTGMTTAATTYGNVTEGVLDNVTPLARHYRMNCQRPSSCSVRCGMTADAHALVV